MRQSARGGAGNGTAAADSRPVSIGTVLSTLRDEFPEVTISKIRFLESEGLVEPQRTPSGYRKFSPQDIERLAQVLRMQRDHYLPSRSSRSTSTPSSAARSTRSPASAGSARPRRPTPAPPPSAASAGRSSWPPPRSARRNSPNGSRTG